ncbi:Ribonuclease H-like superfamily protein [Rhynchospora pubera]|uniref:Ribonuclease H-like superfamily protein n=1 Tax=Rhynchospora pubera TaxID=906938 RepID=A0AAV8C972_9POAL|nr:Ribonuclease H-like superfamily protein [Rhynchospora pubera]
MRELSMLFGEEKAVIIDTQVSKPGGSPLLADKLIWLKAKNGKYTVKQGFDQLQGAITQVPRDRLNLQWVDMWNWKGIIPKVKVFIWRLISKSLPVAQNMHRRIHALSPVCHRCGEENEFETHCMFFCHSSRVVWFGSRLGLATHDLPLNIEDAFANITRGLDEEGRRYVCYTLWEIWLARNQEFFQHKKVQPTTIWRKVDEHVTLGCGTEQVGPHMSSAGGELMVHRLCIQEWMVLLDASCDAQGRAGLAALIYRRGELMGIGLNYQQGVDPFWGEALALVEALHCIKYLIQYDLMPNITLLTDCLNLVDAIKEQDIDNIPSWRARDTIALAICEISHYEEIIDVKHVKREYVKPADVLANHARRKNLYYRGLPCPQLLNFNPDARLLDSRLFVQLQDRPP